VDQKLQDKLNKRKQEGTLRSLSCLSEHVDFYSNDYLGFSKLPQNTGQQKVSSGSTGSRLISGTSNAALEAEVFLAKFFHAASALIFNSGYDANIGFFSAVPQKGDTVFYDEFIHASVRDGVRLSFANSFSFKHNDIVDLEMKLAKTEGVKYVVIESLYSMDGDFSPLVEIAELCVKSNTYLIVDEAHSCGVFGSNGRGLVSELGLEKSVFARIVTFGKAYGLHGACVLGEQDLITFLLNFARSFIYTTALPPAVYEDISRNVSHPLVNENRLRLNQVITFFRDSIRNVLLVSDEKSPIQLIRIGDVGQTQNLSKILQENRLAVKPIYSPTVPIGSEGIRICLHAFNTFEEVNRLVQTISKNC
jgi:8-amino-7-oxononanoate synthase